MKRSLFALCLTLIASNALHAATVQDYIDACVKKSNMGSALCECVANKARNKLSDLGFDFFVAMIQNDSAKSGSLVQQLDQTEIMTATMLTMKGPMECANEGAR